MTRCEGDTDRIADGRAVGVDRAVDAHGGRGGPSVPGPPNGGGGHRLPLPPRDRLAGPPGVLRALIDGVEAPPPGRRRRDLGPAPHHAAAPGGRGRADRLGGLDGLEHQPGHQTQGNPGKATGSDTRHHYADGLESPASRGVIAGTLQAWRICSVNERKQREGILQRRTRVAWIVGGPRT